MRVSICINVDSRPENPVAEKMFNGTVNEDYLTDGVFNKIKFFDGFEKEVIVFVDEHLPLSQKAHDYLLSMADTLVIRQHTNEPSFNDWNYLRCLYMASGDIIFHCDQDTMCFGKEPDSALELINMLDSYKFISYPSPWSPRAVHDESFGHRTWASTRFFICKRDAIKFQELENCIIEPEWGYAKYGDSPRRVNWLEHFLSLVNNDSVFYPPPSPNYTIFSWGTYRTGTIQKMNTMTFDEVNNFVNSNGGIVYPNDLHLR